MNTAKSPIDSQVPHRINPDAKLSDGALAYFDLLIGEYQSIKDRQCDDPQARTLADEFSVAYKGEKSLLTWGDLYAFDRLLLRLRTPDEIRERIPALESRYIEMAQPSIYTDYLSKLPIDQADTSETKIRARIDGLVSEFYRFLIVASARERLRDRASRRLTYWILGFLIVFLAAGVVNRKLESLPKAVATMTADAMSQAGNQPSSSVQAANEGKTLQPVPTANDGTAFQPTFWTHLSGTNIAVIFAGALGGFISAQRRIQSVHKRTTLLELISTEQEGPMHSTAPVSGAVFALVLYTMFTAGLISGSLFPNISTPVSQSPYLRFWTYFVFTGPSNGVDWAKLMIWSFVAGFAERFVPDALTRLATTRSTDQKPPATQ